MKAKLLILLIILLSLTLRTYRMDQYMTFLGDEGRDMLVVKRMIIDGKFTLLGPTTSVGAMYMGPIYYYMISPFLWIAGLNPIGPSLMVAFMSAGTSILIFLFLRKAFSVRAGLIGALFYSITPIAIIYGRSSWNPNVVPFFSILLIYSLRQGFEKGKMLNFFMAGGSLGILLQLHYVAFLFLPVLSGIALIYRKFITKKRLSFFFLGLLLFYSPFILFELRHDFVNSTQAIRFMTQQQSEAGVNLGNIIKTVSDITVRLFWRVFTYSSAEIAKLIILFTFITFYFKRKAIKGLRIRSFKMVVTWFILGILSFGLYRGVIYDYYLGSLFVLPFVFFGMLFFFLYRTLLGKLVLILTSFYILIVYFMNSPHLIEPNNLYRNTREIAEFVMEKAGKKPYNFALIAANNSDHAYRFFMEKDNRAPLAIENPQIDPNRDTVTDQLLIVCEEKVCQPLGHPLWEIAGFGRAEIEGEWQVSTAKVFKLIRYED